MAGAAGWGLRVGKLRVQRVMQRNGIRARGKRRFRITTTDSRHGLPIAPNLLDRIFTAAAANQVWVGDVTYIATDEGWLFLAVVMDLLSCCIVGWSLAGTDHQRDRQRCPADGLVPALPRPRSRTDLS